jgi:hypothetical protein
MTTREKLGPAPVLTGDPCYYLQGVGGIGAEVLRHGVGGIGAEVLRHGVGGIGAEVLAFRLTALVNTNSANAATADHLDMRLLPRKQRAESISGQVPSRGKS